MKYAIMSDAHSNPVALKTALADAKKRKCGKFLFLGDVSGYGYDVKTTIEMVRQNFDVAIMGNHDAVAAGVDNRPEARMNPNYNVDREQGVTLSDSERNWIRTQEYRHDERTAGFSCVHGDFVAPRDWGYIISAQDAALNFFSCSERLMFCGHSHHATIWSLSKDGKTLFNPMEQRMKRTSAKSESVTLKLKEGCRYIVNCGSIGHPRHDFCTTYAIFDSDSLQVTIRRLPFDFKDYIKSMLLNGLKLPGWLAAVLCASAKAKRG